MQTVSLSQQHKSKHMAFLIALFLCNLIHLAVTIYQFRYANITPQSYYDAKLFFKLDIQICYFWMIGSLTLLSLNVALLLCVKANGISIKSKVILLTLMLMFQLAIGVNVAKDVTARFTYGNTYFITSFILQIADTFATFFIDLPSLLILLITHLEYLANPFENVMSNPNIENQINVPFV